MYIMYIIYNEIEPPGQAMGPPGRQWNRRALLYLLYKSYKLYIYIYICI